MLKTIPPTTSCGCGYFKSKCAEIHYQSASFSILCIFCGVKSSDYQDFVEHFQKLHFDDFAKTLQVTAEPVVTPIYETKRLNNDPLDLENSGEVVTANADEVMHKLKMEGLEIQEVKLETTEEQQVPPKNVVKANAATIAFEDFNESDNEFLICKIKVEQADLRAANPLKPRKSKRKNIATIQLTPATPEHCNVYYEEQQNCNYPIATSIEEVPIQDASANTSDNDNNENDDANDSDVSINVTDDDDEEDIDWSKPYEPNLLKNHDKRPYKPRNNPNICTYCGRTFKRRYQLETHLNVHTGEKPHQCEVCGRQFRAITTLTRHLNTHVVRESFCCKFCKKAFTHKVALLSHELRHTQQRTVACNECDKWFYTANQMDTHKRKVHNKSDQQDLPFVCDICAKRYRTGSMLSTHKFKKHYKMAKFACEQCGKKFVDEQKLLLHKHIHIDGYATSLNPSAVAE